MKKILFILMFAIILFGFSGCRPNRNARQHQEGLLNVKTTIFPAFDFVREIAGDRVNLTMLLSPGAESHSFEPSPRDIINIMNSDVFIYVGESERWIERILQSVNTEEMTVFAMMSSVELLEQVIIHDDYAHHDHDHYDHDHHHHHDDHHGHDHHHDHDDTCSVFDEHIWTSPRNAILVVRALTELLSEADPANAYYFQQNAAAYIEELEQLDAAFLEVVASAERRTIIFGDRFPFLYFANHYGLTWYAAFDGCSTETEPSAARVAFLINKVRDEQIPVVFHIELSNERMADAISRETGAVKRLFHSVHNVSRRDFDAGLGYLELMHRNVEALREALH